MQISHAALYISKTPQLNRDKAKVETDEQYTEQQMKQINGVAGETSKHSDVYR